MYFQPTRAFLNDWKKKELIEYFRYLGINKTATKSNLIDQIIKHIIESEERIGWILICPFCRIEALLSANRVILEKMKTKRCTFCGKHDPYEAFLESMSNSDELIKLASKMITKEEKHIKSILLEQTIVSIITALEIIMRNTYSISYDLQHVIIGKPLYNEIYPKTRVSFLNLGSASKQLKNITNLDLKKVIKLSDYNFLSSMYSARHIIVHNASYKDKEYIKQIGEPETELNKKISLNVSDIRKLVTISKNISYKLNETIKHHIMKYKKESLKFQKTK